MSTASVTLPVLPAMATPVIPAVMSLQFSRQEQELLEMSDVKVQIRDNGPFLITGPVSLTDAAGNVFDLGGKETFSLCRCGASARKPFCDGAHKTCGFQSAERAVPPTA